MVVRTLRGGAGESVIQGGLHHAVSHARGEDEYNRAFPKGNMWWRAIFVSRTIASSVYDLTGLARTTLDWAMIAGRGEPVDGRVDDPPSAGASVPALLPEDVANRKRQRRKGDGGDGRTRLIFDPVVIAVRNWAAEDQQTPPVEVDDPDLGDAGGGVSR